MGSKIRVLWLALVLGVGTSGIEAIAPAQADTYSFSFVGTGVTAQGFITVDGTAPDATKSLNAPPGYDVTAITGTYNGFAISLLSSDPTGLLGPEPDNILYFPGLPTFLDIAGILFSDTNGDLVNLWSDGADTFASNCPNSSCASFADDTVDGVFTVATPLPASLPMLGAVLLIGLLTAPWRNFRKLGWAEPA